MQISYGREIAVLWLTEARRLGRRFGKYSFAWLLFFYRSVNNHEMRLIGQMTQSSEVITVAARLCMMINLGGQSLPLVYTQ